MVAVERADSRLDAVLAIGQLAGRAVAPEQGIPALLEAVARACAATSIVLRLVDVTGVLRVHSVWSADSDGGEAGSDLADQHDDVAEHVAIQGVPRIASARPDAATRTMHVPLLANERTLGVLSVARCDGFYDRDDLCLFVALAGIVGMVIEHGASAQREMAASKHLEVFNTIGRVINSSLDITEVFDTFATETQLLIRHDRLSAHVLAADGLVDEVFAAAGDRALSAYSPGERRPVNASLPARVALTDRPFLSLDLPSDPRIAGNPHLVVPRNARSWLSVPLRANGRAFGALNFSMRAPASYTEAHVPLAQQIADQLATYLALVRLHRQERDLAVAQERARLAREIHDTLSQDLSLLVLQLQALERTTGLAPTIQIEVQEATEQARRALEAARRSLWDLVPSPLEGRDLVTSLEEEVDRLCEATGLRGRVTVLGEARTLTSALEVAAFRITQEALANARKHAEARRIVLRLHYDAQALLLSVEDDGLGFDTSVGGIASASSGFGLVSMRERAHLLGGTLAVTSAPGRGTRVTAQLPYSSPHTEPAPSATHPVPAVGQESGAAGPAAIRVLIADDHAVARHGIRRMLEAQRDIIVVGEAADGQEALDEVARHKPDVVLLDLQMPRVDGTQALHQLQARYPTLGVIILSTFAQDERVFAALRDGARGYVLKDTSLEDLAEAVRVVAAGGSQLQGKVATQLVGRLQRRDTPTARELAVLRLADEGLRSKEIAARLVISERTVNFHLNNAYRKLDASGRTEALRIARARGLLLSL